MRTKWYICFLALLAACTKLTSESNLKEDFSPTVSATASQKYDLRQQIFLSNEGDNPPDKQNLWVALIRDIDPYQTVQSRSISPENYTIVTDEYGNQYAEFDFKDHPAGTTISVEIQYQITVFEQIIDTGDCKGQLPDEFTRPELHIESANPQIVSLSKELSQGKQTPCAQVRAFYDYVGDKLIYSYNHNDWGAQATLGYMGSDCTEYSSLMTALSRAAGIPARYYTGLLYLEDQPQDMVQTEHAWLDVYLPRVGWATMDPTLGRFLIAREQYFARHTLEHIIVTVGRNPSTLRGSSYWSHLYWPGDGTTIRVKSADWVITPTQ